MGQTCQTSGTNPFDDDKLRALCDTSNPLFEYYERRVGAMRRLLAEGEANGRIDGEVFWQEMLNHEEGGAGCQHRETMPDGVELFTHVAYYHLPAEKRTFLLNCTTINGCAWGTYLNDASGRSCVFVTSQLCGWSSVARRVKLIERDRFVFEHDGYLIPNRIKKFTVITK